MELDVLILCSEQVKDLWWPQQYKITNVRIRKHLRNPFDIEKKMLQLPITMSVMLPTANLCLILDSYNINYIQAKDELKLPLGDSI